MASPVPAPTRIRFDAFELDVASGELRKSGILLKLQPQPFRVLLLLIERAGQVVTREEIQRCLWTDSTFVDFEHGINFSVGQIRSALVDSAENPRYVETIPRRGYRFIGGVEQETVSTSASAVDARPSVKPARKKHLVVACVLLLAAAFAAYHFWPRNTPRGPGKITQISQWNKPMNEARLSPDGDAIAFTSPVGGIAQVFLMLTSGGEPLQLTSDEGDKDVNTFSPDGKEVYYGSPLGRGDVWAAPALGGAPRHVVASARNVVPSLDGAFIYYTKTESNGLFRAEKSGLNEELVYNAEGTGLFFIPLLLFPGNNNLLAAGVSMDFDPKSVFYRIDMTNHQAVDLGEVPGNLFEVVWAEPGNSVLFSRTINRLTNIWSYSLKDRSLTQITFGTGPDFSPMPDPGGKGIYFVNGKSSGFLTAYHVHSKESTDIVSEDATGPRISPDGKHLMYITHIGVQRSELWVSDIDGGNKVKIATGESLGTGNWAPDNFHLSFEEERAGTVDKAYIVGADGSGLRQLPQMGVFVWGSTWSPDQKTIYVTGVEKGRKMPTVWKWSVDGSNPEKIAYRCCMISDADSAGHYLLGGVTIGEKTGIYEVSLSDRRCIPLIPGAASMATFAPDGKSLLYAVASRSEVTIYRQPWGEGKLTGSPQVALKVPFAFPLEYGGDAYDFSRDLSTIVYARPSGQADLYLLSQK